MLKVELITQVDDQLAEEMASLQEVLLKGKHGRPLNRQLFRDCIDTGFLVGAFMESCPYLPGEDPEYTRELAGMCFLYIQQTISRRVMNYEELVVKPAFRGQGVADKIDEFLVRLARERDCDCIEGVMPFGNEAVKKVHLRNGFSIREQHPFRLILHQF